MVAAGPRDTVMARTRPVSVHTSSVQTLHTIRPTLCMQINAEVFWRVALCLPRPHAMDVQPNTRATKDLAKLTRCPACVNAQVMKPFRASSRVLNNGTARAVMQIERAKGAAIKITDVLELIQFERLREGIARQACLREGMHVFESVACFVWIQCLGRAGLFRALVLAHRTLIMESGTVGRGASMHARPWHQR